MEIQLEKVISRLDIEAYQDILGKEVIGTLSLLGANYLYAEGLNKILSNTFSNEELLTNSTSRNFIIDALRKEEIEILQQNLNLNIKNDYWNRIKSVDYKAENLAILLDFFGEILSEDIVVQWIQEENILPSYPLYPYQREVLKKIKKVLSTEKNRVLLHMPTGSGKTRTSINYICNHFIENDSTNVVWFANTVELLDQAYNEFVKAWNHLGNRKIKVVKYWGKSTIDLSKLKGCFIVAGLDKTYNALLKDVAKMSEFSNNCSLVIMDEAHQAIAPTYSLLIDSLLIVNKASLIGLSATPGRTWNDPDEDIKLADFFFRQKAKLIIDGYENPVDYLVANKYIAQTKNTTLLHNSGIQLSDIDLKHLKDNYVLSNEVLEKISTDRLRNLAIISKIKLLVKSHQRIIVFAITKSHAIVLNSLLTAIDLKSSVVTSDTNPNDRVKIIDNFKVSRKDNPESLILCNYGILTTGFDAPETSCAVIARPTDSLVLYSQMVGRAIRGEESGGNKEAEIVTVIDQDLPGFGNVADAFTNWDDVWNEIN
ncbi:DEAD/DEAH box helicase [Flavobacterium sp. N502540]|uniref:DEAD/DEAH box helicase n=1 Tax=Flavobacterium sp. N502540 TaxID=2986838 RepID=UPI0022245486|nr:DEAD/DEAH box helicase [Flavobacterium sp. N502540]